MNFNGKGNILELTSLRTGLHKIELSIKSSNNEEYSKEILLEVTNNNDSEMEK